MNSGYVITSITVSGKLKIQYFDSTIRHCFESPALQNDVPHPVVRDIGNCKVLFRVFGRETAFRPEDDVAGAGMGETAFFFLKLKNQKKLVLIWSAPAPRSQAPTAPRVFGSVPQPHATSSCAFRLIVFALGHDLHGQNSTVGLHSPLECRQHRPDWHLRTYVPFAEGGSLRCNSRSPVHPATKPKLCSPAVRRIVANEKGVYSRAGLPNECLRGRLNEYSFVFPPLPQLVLQYIRSYAMVLVLL